MTHNGPKLTIEEIDQLLEDLSNNQPEYPPDMPGGSVVLTQQERKQFDERGHIVRHHANRRLRVILSTQRRNQP